jgi:hypothetical protein
MAPPEPAPPVDVLPVTVVLPVEDVCVLVFTTLMQLLLLTCLLSVVFEVMLLVEPGPVLLMLLTGLTTGREGALPPSPTEGCVTTGAGFEITGLVTLWLVGA